MVKVFIDFDGTITLNDVGDSMFERFGGERCTRLVDEYRKGGLSAVECFRRECAACGEISREELDSFLDRQLIDSSLKDFLAFCVAQGIETVILSDGMDYYIERILHREGIGGIRSFANHLDLLPIDGRKTVTLFPSFPSTDEVCDRCACCKRNQILTLTGDDDIIVYIGEGYSDCCPVRFADLVFAKDELLRFCRRENISCFEYRSFAEVRERMSSLLGDGKRGNHQLLRKRRQAQLASREVFLGG